MKNSDQPAFPTDKSIYGKYYGGLTKREYFSVMAMQGISNGIGIVNTDTVLEVPENCAGWAVRFADALLAELEKTIP